MKKYHSLKTYKYENPTANITKEYESRLNGVTTIVTNLFINAENKGQRTSKTFPLFVMPVQKLLILQSEVEQNSRMISKLTDSLPQIAYNQFFNRTLVNEIMSTNEIESVKTTNQEVTSAIENAQNNVLKKSRLQSFALMYLKIKNSENQIIDSLKDIRDIYDFLLEGEVPSDKMPDGDLFRNRFVRIGTDIETVHQPKSTEQEIEADLKDWILFINNDDISPFIKAFVAHYFFENIHPFNDGNGRIGRYIVCVYLGYKFDPLSAITFSSETNKNKSKYYKAFQEVSDPLNYGEVTFFLIEMAKLVISGQKNIIEEMTKNKVILDAIKTYIKDDKKLADIDRKVLYLYSQAFLFNDLSDGLRDNEFKAFMKDEHWTNVKATIDNLTEKNILTKTKKSPIVRKLSDTYIHDFYSIFNEAD